MNFFSFDLVAAAYIVPAIVFGFYQIKHEMYLSRRDNGVKASNFDLEARLRDEHQLVRSNPEFAEIHRRRNIAFKLLLWLYGTSFVIGILVAVWFRP